MVALLVLKDLEPLQQPAGFPAAGRVLWISVNEPVLHSSWFPW